MLIACTMQWFPKHGFRQFDPDPVPEARKRKYNRHRKRLVLVKKL